MIPGFWELILILAIVLVFFGPRALPGLGKSMGEAIRGFKKGMSGDEIDVTPESRREQLAENEKEDQPLSKKKETDKV